MQRVRTVTSLRASLITVESIEDVQSPKGRYLAASPQKGEGASAATSVTSSANLVAVTTSACAQPAAQPGDKRSHGTHVLERRAG